MISLLSRVDANWVEARLEKGNNNKNDNSNRVGLIPVTYIKVRFEELKRQAIKYVRRGKIYIKHNM